MEEKARWVEAEYSWPTYVLHVHEDGYVLCLECTEAEEARETVPVEEVETPPVCDRCSRVILGPSITSAAGCASHAVLEGLEVLGDARKVGESTYKEEEYGIDSLSSAYRLLTSRPNSPPKTVWEVYGGEYLILDFGPGFLALRRKW